MKRLPEFLSPIAARRVASGTYAEPYTVIPVAKILYAFNQSATTLGLIDALWIGSLGFRRGHIYVRTREGVFFVHYRSLTELMERLGPHHFLALNHSVFVNLHQVTSLARLYPIRLRNKRYLLSAPIPSAGFLPSQCGTPTWQ